MIELQIKGIDELKRALEELPAKLQKNTLRGAVRAASKPVLDEARRRAPVLQTADVRRKPGTLRNAIKLRGTLINGKLVVGGISVKGLSQAQIAKFKAGAKTAGANNPNDPFYARFVEFGTAKMAARPFMRPALSSKAQDAIDAMGAYIADRLEIDLK